MNLASYVKEFGYAMTATPNWRNRWALLSATAAFHLNNRAKRKKTDSDPVDIGLRLGDRVQQVSVRPYAGDIFVLYEVLALKSYEIPEMCAPPAQVRTIIDCGANIGITALYMAARYPNAKIVCIEPDPHNFELLERNTRHETRIVPVQAALVGEVQGPIYLTQDAPAWGNQLSSKKGNRAAIKVDAVTIDQIRAEYDIDFIDVLKVDIEGAEEDVFARPDFLSKVHFIVIELHNAYTLDRFQQDIAPMGFDASPPGALGGVRAVTAFPNG